MNLFDVINDVQEHVIEILIRLFPLFSFHLVGFSDDSSGEPLICVVFQLWRVKNVIVFSLWLGPVRYWSSSSSASCGHPWVGRLLSVPCDDDHRMCTRSSTVRGVEFLFYSFLKSFVPLSFPFRLVQHKSYFILCVSSARYMWNKLSAGSWMRACSHINRFMAYVYELSKWIFLVGCLSVESWNAHRFWYAIPLIALIFIEIFNNTVTFVSFSAIFPSIDLFSHKISSFPPFDFSTCFELHDSSNEFRIVINRIFILLLRSLIINSLFEELWHWHLMNSRRNTIEFPSGLNSFGFWHICDK